MACPVHIIVFQNLRSFFAFSGSKLSYNYRIIEHLATLSLTHESRLGRATAVVRPRLVIINAGQISSTSVHTICAANNLIINFDQEFNLMR